MPIINKKSRKTYFLSLLLVLFFLLFTFALFNFALSQGEGKSLEVEYPGFGIKTIQKDLFPRYLKYVLTFVISISGIIALGVLITAGYRYITSTGRPEQLKKAQDQILSAFWGLIILLGSFIILNTINPQIISLEVPELERINLPAPLPEPPAAPPAYPNRLWRITEIGDTVKTILDGKEKGAIKTAQNIKSYTQKCDCGYTHPLCLCQKYMGGSCSATYCYSQKTTEPCPDDTTIKQNQQDIIASLFELLYYRNRAINEREDILLLIDNYKKMIAFYDEKIRVEQEHLSKITGEYGKQVQMTYIDGLEKEKSKLTSAQPLNESLEKKLNELSDLINRMNPLISGPEGISKLPDQCLPGVEAVCKGQCKGGCHNTRECSPASCQGGNPCPIAKIGTSLSQIQSIRGQIIAVCDEIIRIVSKLIKI